jgi:hypothetical protein
VAPAQDQAQQQPAQQLGSQQQQQVDSLVAQLQRLQQQHKQEVAARDEMLVKCRRVILVLESRVKQHKGQ